MNISKHWGNCVEVLLSDSDFSLQCVLEVFSVTLMCQKMRTKQTIIQCCGDRALAPVKLPKPFEKDCSFFQHSAPVIYEMLFGVK